jgi:hypothetical protein
MNWKVCVKDVIMPTFEVLFEHCMEVEPCQDSYVGDKIRTWHILTPSKEHYLLKNLLGMKQYLICR